MTIIKTKAFSPSLPVAAVLFAALLTACGDTPQDQQADSTAHSPSTVPTQVTVSPDAIYSDAQTDAENIAWAEANIDKALERKEFSAKNGLTMPYRLFVPENYSPEQSYPLLVFLHGRGDRGSDNRADIYDNTGLFDGPQSIISPNMQAQYPSLVLVPQCADTRPDEEWAHAEGNTPEEPFKGLGADGHYQQHPEPSASGAAALELIEKIIADYAVDQDRVYLTGVSMGGFGTWEFITRRPDLFAAAVPMAGYSDPSQVEKIKHIPIWIFHGDQDEYNPVQGSRNMARLLGMNGAEVRYSELRGFKHVDSFEEAWKNRQIIPWMFSKKRRTQE